MEVQYVAEDHIWFKDSFENPSSPFSQHIIYNGPDNTDPESIIFDLKEIHSYDGRVKKVACLNLFNPATQELIFEEFRYWLDPMGDGSLRSGVDGFRLDHMMDDLDDKGKLTQVYSRFWKPIIQKAKAINDQVKFIGEQANWESHGDLAFREADVDYMFAFPLKFAISEQNVSRIKWTQIDGLNKTPEGKSQIIVIENHDTTRYATTVGRNPGLLRVGATLNILLKGLPALYYGQELGMEGAGGFQSYGRSDGNDIPRREAFPWEELTNSPGAALWYKESGPWWDDSKLADSDGISVEEQLKDPQSLLHFYKTLIRIRKRHTAFQNGDIKFLENQSDKAIAFTREWEEQIFLVQVNFSNEELEYCFQDFVWQEDLLRYPLDQSVTVFPAFGVRISKVETRIEHTALFET
jgi:glycosidase